MSNALAHRDELNMVTAPFDRSINEIRDEVIHSIVNMVLRLNKRGERVSIHFEDGYLSICRFVNETEHGIKHIASNGDIYLKTAEQLIDALQQLEDLDQQEFINDTLSLFAKKEDTDNAEDL